MYIPFKVLDKNGAIFIGIAKDDCINVNDMCFGNVDGCYGFRSDGSKAQYGKHQQVKWLEEKWDIDEKLWLKLDFTNDSISFNTGNNWKAGTKGDAFKNVDLKSGSFKILIALQGIKDSVKIINTWIKYEDIKPKQVSINNMATPALLEPQESEYVQNAKPAELEKLAEKKKEAG